MLEKLMSLVGDAKQQNRLALGAGTLALLAGRKVVAAGLVVKAIRGIEADWRARHPDFQGDFKARWAKAFEFYESTHMDPTNRWLHVVGIPIIVASTLGLVISAPPRPIWAVSVVGFVIGWALNLVGHKYYEKNAPALLDDPLSFVAGPVWDFKNIFGKKMASQDTTATSVTPPAAGFRGAPASA
jgi:hypothetical protein